MKISGLSSEELVSRLILNVINYEENKDKLQEFPVVKKGNFAILAQLCVGEKNDAGRYTACLTVTNSMLEMWGWPKEQLFEVAADNSKRLFPTVYQPLDRYMDRTYPNIQMQFSDNIDMANVIVLTNEQHYNGAATLFYDPEAIKDIADQCKADQMLLLPAGINQIYCLPLKDSSEIKEWQDIYGELVEMIGKEKCLNDNILTYDSGTQLVNEANGQTFGLDLSENTMRMQERRR